MGIQKQGILYFESAVDLWSQVSLSGSSGGMFYSLLLHCAVVIAFSSGADIEKDGSTCNPCLYSFNDRIITLRRMWEQQQLDKGISVWIKSPDSGGEPHCSDFSPSCFGQR